MKVVFIIYLLFLKFYLFQSIIFDHVFNFDKLQCKTKSIKSLTSNLEISINSLYNDPETTSSVYPVFNITQVTNENEYNTEEIEKRSLIKDKYLLNIKPLCLDYGGLTLYQESYPSLTSNLIKDGIASSSTSLISDDEGVENFSIFLNYQPCFSCKHEQIIIKMNNESTQDIKDQFYFSQLSANNTHISYKLFFELANIGKITYLYHVSIENVRNPININVFNLFFSLFLYIFFSLFHIIL